MRRAGKGRGFFHVMVTEYILRALKSAHQTLGKRLQHSKDAQREPFQLQQVRRAEEMEFKQTEFLHRHYKGMFSFFRC